MNAFRNLFPHPHTFFPTRSCQSRSRNGNSGRNSRAPGWRFYRESEDFSTCGPGRGAGAPRTPFYSSLRNAPRVHLRQERRSGDGRGVGDGSLGENDGRYGREGVGRSRREREGEDFLRSGGERAPKRWSGLRMDGCGRVGGVSSREKEREREIKRELQRSIEEVMDMQENVLRELDMVEDEWKCIERAWEVLEEDMDMDMDRERNLRGRELNGLGEDRGMLGSNRNGRRYIRLNEGVWENMGVNSREMGGLF